MNNKKLSRLLGRCGPLRAFRLPQPRKGLSRRHIVLQEIPVIILNQGRKHRLRGQGSHNGRGGRVHADSPPVISGRQFLLKLLIEHIAAFRPPGGHLGPNLFLILAGIEHKHIPPHLGGLGKGLYGADSQSIRILGTQRNPDPVVFASPCA